METLTGNGVAIGSGEPEGAAAMSVGRVFVHQVLDEGEVLLMLFEWLEDFGHLVVSADSIEIGIPSVGGDAEAHAEEDHAFGGSGSLGGGGGKFPEAERFQEGEGDEGFAAVKESATGLVEMGHGESLLGLESVRLDEGVDEEAEFEVVFFGLFEKGVGEGFVDETVGSAEAVADEGLGEAPGELVGFGGDVIAKFVEVGDFFAGVKSAG